MLERLRSRSLATGAAVLLGLALAPPAGAEGLIAKVTALAGGGASAGERGLELRSDVAAGESVQTRSDSSCSLLMAGETLVQLCGATRVEARTSEKDGRYSIDVKQGRLRALVGEQPADQPLEIHTPVAVAQILGTTVYVDVDPTTGVTTIGSADNPIVVQNSDPSVVGSVTICCGQKVTIAPGKPPGAPSELEKEDVSGIHDCLGDLHQPPLAEDRSRNELAMMDSLAGGEADTLPPVAGGPEEFLPPDEPPDPEQECEDIVQCGNFPIGEEPPGEPEEEPEIPEEPPSLNPDPCSLVPPAEGCAPPPRPVPNP
jgi:hypothetical protein